jgi:hypothetical protein
MTECRAVLKLIDESDRPETLSVEAENHIGLCADCRTFAEQREQLRKLLSSCARMQAPANFDALLRQRLDKARSASFFYWFQPALLARVGAAAAAVAVLVFVAKFTLLPGQSGPKEEEKHIVAYAGSIDVKPSAPPAIQGQGQLSNPTSRIPRPAKHNSVKPQHRSRSADIALDPHYIIVRGENGDTAVPIFPVSVGAQPQLYTSPHTTQPALVRTSF